MANTEALGLAITHLIEKIHNIEGTSDEHQLPLRCVRWDACVDTAAIILGAKPGLTISFGMVTQLACELYLLKLGSPHNLYQDKEAV